MTNRGSLGYHTVVPCSSTFLDQKFPDFHIKNCGAVKDSNCWHVPLSLISGESQS